MHLSAWKFDRLRLVCLICFLFVVLRRILAHRCAAMLVYSFPLKVRNRLVLDAFDTFVMTSLIQLARHKVAAISVVFPPLQTSIL